MKLLVMSPVAVGVITGLALPFLLFGIEYSLERKAKKAAESKGAKIWCTLSPQRKIRDFKTGLVKLTNEEIDFDPRHGHYTATK